MSTRYEYVTPLHRSFESNEFTARIVFVPASRSGPPESPKQTPPSLACSLMKLSLIRAAKRVQGAVVVVSIFVNPLQFGAGEDLDRYPRDLDAEQT